MNETDTKAYIKAQVDKQLSARFWRIAAIIGAIDLVALGGIYWTVLSTARSTAIGVAKEAAEASPLHADFQRLQNWLQLGNDKSLVYYVFDAPYLGGFDLTRTPLAQRKAALEKVLKAGGRKAKP